MISKAIQNLSKLNLNNHVAKSLNPNTKLYVCDFNLIKKCKYGVNCHNYHVETAYMWQYLENDGVEWFNFSNELNKIAENAYCNPKIKKFCLRYNF